VLQCVHVSENSHDQADLIHGDIKRENIVVSVAGEVKLIDYGFMCPLLRSDLEEARICLYNSKSNIRYAAPETRWIKSKQPDQINDTSLVPVKLLEELATAAGTSWSWMTVLKALDIWMLG
jgi:serine/threonine protein kinase